MDQSANRLPITRILVFAAGLFFLITAAAAKEASETVQRDWYFRESLRAIRDWEDIQATWEKQTPAKQRTPVLPVPADGAEVAWPNPIPARLLPAADAGEKIHIRCTSPGEITVIHSGGTTQTEPKVYAANEVVLGYKHPGGGGKDQWYHSYQRRFDQLTQFRPKLAPFSADLKSMHYFQPGDNALAVTFRNAAKTNVTVAFSLRVLTVNGEAARHAATVMILADSVTNIPLPVSLNMPGGSLLILDMTCAGQSYWLPLLAHVEDVPAIMSGIKKILADAPDASAQKRWEELQTQVSKGPLQSNWRSLFAEASTLRDELLYQRIDFENLLFIKRKPYYSEQPFMDSHHLYNRPGGGIYRLSPVRPSGAVTPVMDNLGEGIYRDLSLHWQTNKLLFSFGNGSDKWNTKQSYHIYETDLAKLTVRPLTAGPKNDCEPFYLPHNGIGFTSDRAEHFVMCGGNRHVANLFVMNGDGSSVRQLSFNVFNDFNPSLLPDGRILYSRWEYNERSVTSLHKLFTINPDGTMMAPYYGNATIRPNVTMFPRPVPKSHKIMALFTAHHGQTHGPIGLIDVRQGVDGETPITVLTPGVPVTGEKVEDSRYGWFSDPWPLSETTYLCSYTPTVLPWLERSWALYLGDRHGNLALIYRDSDISCAEPIPVIKRTPPQTLPSAPSNTETNNAETALLMQDVYRGLTGVEKGTAKFLRVLEDVPRKSVPEGGVITTAATEIYTVKRILGTVPIDPDGSAHFLVPANRNIYFEVLDDQYREIQRMRSVVCVKPGENRTCVGCHESRQTTPPNVKWTAASRPPNRPAPPPWGLKTLSFLRDLQPLLNDKCVSCHAFDRTANGVILTDDLTDQFNVAYEELIPFLSTANAKRWDHPEDVLPRPPYTYGSKVSRLTRLLEAGHYQVTLTEQEWQRLFVWIDANGVYYDRYESTYRDRRIFNAAFREKINAIYQNRCANCHGQTSRDLNGLGALSINRRNPKASRALQAPLAKAAGGWERCAETVFADINDSDYQKLLAAFTELNSTLTQRPREDLLSLRGTEAEFQQVNYPLPPPKSTAKPVLSGNDVFASDLPWKSARAGWTPNQDGLPRRDKDIENRPMRLGNRTYHKGLGTHAPSEIVYSLKGVYERFTAKVGGAEAKGTVIFKVYGDDTLLFESPVLQGLREVKSVDVLLTGVQELRLVVTDAGDNINCDEANWADARLIKKLEKN